MRRFPLLTAVTALMLVAGSAQAVPSGSFSPAAPLGVARNLFDAVTLVDGRVLVAGGSGPGALGTSEVYDPAVDEWGAAGALNHGRNRHTLTLLPNGSVLAAGGRAPGGVLASSEVFDPGTGTWRLTASMSVDRDNHTATSLADGRVLVVGGTSDAAAPVTRTAELYDPATGTWSDAGSLRTPRYNHTATLLADGRVLVAGGFSPGSFHTPVRNAEVFDPATLRWSAVSPMRVARAVHGASLLPDGSVLVAGGLVSPPNLLHATASAEIWDPASGRWHDAAPMFAPRRALDTLVPVAGGRLLAIGGFNDANQLQSSAETYDATTDSWAAAGSMSTPRAPVLARLLDGRVLAIGSTGRVLVTDVDVWSPSGE